MAVLVLFKVYASASHGVFFERLRYELNADFDFSFIRLPDLATKGVRL
jgi:hypothetical protein